jgi:GT2 family glycosyltransferase
LAAEEVGVLMIAIIIVNYGRATDTIECLDSLLNVTEPAFEVFLADNGSGFEDVEILQKYCAQHEKYRLHFISYPENHGFAGAHNRLLKPLLQEGRFEYILLLNNDTVVEPEFLVAMLRVIDCSRQIEMVAARMLRYDDPTQVDSLGITFYKSGLASNRKSLDDPLLGPTGGCALYSLDLLRQIHQQAGEIFDEQFFCYAEDTDLAWRAFWLGYVAGYAQDAIVYHKGSVSSGGPNSDFVLYYGIRNSLFVLAKDVPLAWIILNIGWIFLMHLAIPLRHVVRGKSRVIWQLYRDFFKSMPLMLRKRSQMRAHRLRSGFDVWKLTSRSFYEAGYVKKRTT